MRAVITLDGFALNAPANAPAPAFGDANSDDAPAASSRAAALHAESEEASKEARAALVKGQLRPPPSDQGEVITGESEAD